MIFERSLTITNTFKFLLKINSLSEYEGMYVARFRIYMRNRILELLYFKSRTTLFKQNNTDVFLKSL